MGNDTCPVQRGQDVLSAPAGIKADRAEEFDMGSDEPMFRDAQPVHRQSVNGFWIDETDVTNGEFVRAADWRYLEETASSIEICIDHPVLHIAYADDDAYAKWSGNRMLTETERAFAPPGGPSRKRFIWVNSFLPKGDAIALTFQEEFPVRNRYGDGYGSTSPIKAFPPSGYGPSEMAGNVRGGRPTGTGATPMPSA